MNARVLSPDEWGKLDATSIPQIGPTLKPENVRVIVVEDGEKIAGTMVVMRVVHFESLFLSPEYRGSPELVGRLWTEATRIAKDWTDTWVWAASDTDHMNDIIGRVGGVKLPVESFVIPIGGN